jgi:hypothetical protein
VGTTAITASAGQVSSGAALTVTAAVVPVASVSVSPSNQSISQGGTVQLTATPLDAGGAALSGRPIAWTTSNQGVATVSSTGLVTGVAAGTAAIIATSEGRSGSANITVLAATPLSVTGVTPGNGAVDRSIETTVLITFSQNVNPATVTAQSVTLTRAGNAVGAARSVSGNVVTLTPDQPLIEFNTAYVVTVTTSVTSSQGNPLSSNFTANFTTVFWDPNYYYRLSNDYRGPNEFLDTYSQTRLCHMSVGNFSGQRWYFLPIANHPGYYSMQNQFGGSGFGLEGANSPDPCILLGSFIPSQAPTGMIWRAVSAGGGRYYLQNLNFGGARSLDTPLLNGVPHPSMQATGNLSGQHWLFTRMERR